MTTALVADRESAYAAAVDSCAGHATPEDRCYIRDLGRELASARASNEQIDAARAVLTRIDDVIAEVLRTGESQEVFRTFTIERKQPYTSAEILADPVASELWQRVASAAGVTPQIQSSKVWSDSGEYPLSPFTGLDRNFDNTFVQLGKIIVAKTGN